MFLLYRVVFFCNFANSSICKTFLGLISCNAVTLYFSFISCTLFLFSLHVNVSIVIRSVVTK